ncbi:zona pellucida sperm-binding protein 3 receptor-like [Pelobates fuscus]|uniref:zona pellucida sperm-binding protein 3 receptor-like n=1 Tax=Pelobates fuscus TaxID=191477 RepID=UPI002FE4302C
MMLRSKLNYFILLNFYLTIVVFGYQDRGSLFSQISQQPTTSFPVTENVDHAKLSEIDDCGPPPDLQYGELREFYMDTNKFSKDNIVYYKCRPGYAPVPNTKTYITCLGASQWSSPDVFCNPACGQPPVLEYGDLQENFVEVAYFPVGDKVYYKCKPDYVYVQGAKTDITCLEELEWSVPDIFCKSAPTCGPPPRLQDLEPKEAYLSRTSFAVKEKVEFQCRPGYTFSFSRFRNIAASCESNLEWSFSHPSSNTFCKRKSCGNPGDIINGAYEAADFTFGSKAVYKCNNGYRMLTKRNYRECLADGQWSNITPECEAVICENPSALTNGYYSPDKDQYEYLDSVKYSCNQGLELIGEASVYCTSDGNWSSNPPECKVVRCPEPGIVPNSRKTSGFYGSYKLNFVVTYECLSGYQMVGFASVKCNVNNEWEPALPKCLGKCWSYPPSLEYAELDKSIFGKIYLEDSEVSYRCREGYEPVPGTEPSIKCLGKKGWSTPQRFCTLRSCGNPGEIENGHMNATNNFLFKSYVIYNCSKGYKMISNSKLYCQADGTWSSSPPTCKEIICATPSITDGTYSPEKMKYSEMDLLTFSCNGNLKLIGDHSLHCVSPGVWNSSVPECQAVCDSPPVIENTVLEIQLADSSYFDINATVQYVCQPGFSHIPNTSNTITCTNNLTWSTPETFCQRRSCGNPGEIPNAQMEATDFLFESNVSYHCLTGYKLATSINFRYCQANGNWSEIVPACEVQTCPVPHTGPKESYRPQKKKYQYQDSISYKCHDGLSLFGKTSLTCTEHGKWSSFTPHCKESQCDKIWAVQEEMRKCTSTPDDWIKYLQIEYLHLQIENLKLDIEWKKKGRKY